MATGDTSVTEVRGKSDAAAATRSQIPHFAVLGMLGWTLIVAASLLWNFRNIDQQTLSLATEKARSTWNKDQAFRLWATRHGGLYVRPNRRTPPNPYLSHLADRDITTTDGQALTIMNPAYMMRQMTIEFEEIYGIKGKITGRVQLNPINKPDPWESEALAMFENGITEVTAQAHIDGSPYLRFMKPVFMEEGCLSCHGHLGIAVGAVRGGVSVSVPLSPYLASTAATKTSLSATHGVVWLMGLCLIGLFAFETHKRWTEREEAARALAWAKQEAESASAAKSEFLAHMSHELRTPLNSIIGFSEVLVDQMFGKIENPKYNEYARDIHAASSHLLGVIGDILDLSKIEAGQLDFTETTFDIATVLRDCRLLVQGMAKDKEIRVDLPRLNEPLSLYGSEPQVRQIVVNLFSNAVKYTNHGGAIEAEAFRLADKSTVIRIKDTGVGIAAEHLPIITEPFSKVRRNAFVQSAGTGLGLTISKKLMEQHGGEIHIASEVGVGTEISLVFPPERTLQAA